MSSVEWFYIGHFGRLGPLTEDQVVELVRDGVIEKKTYVWRAGMPDWSHADTVLELIPTFREIHSLTPPPEPVATPSPSFGGYSSPPISPYGSYQQPMAYAPLQTYAHGPINFASLPRSDKNRLIAGIVQLIIPGSGRMYLGYWAQGFVQLLTAPICGVGFIWSVVDGIAMLCGSTKVDGYGRALND
ncbi:MAG: DUF4339 domain-containing protein [Chthonomonas sp.]|nr:DUF4339 domain-containing protein [Chthonomonas sp.]